MSVALRLAERLEAGEGVPPDEGSIAFLATLFAPLYGRGVSIQSGGPGGNYASSRPLRRCGDN